MMEKTNRQLASDIKAMRAPEVALPELMNRMASAYGLLSLYNLAMELSMFAESKEEGRIHPDKQTAELEETLRRMIKETLLAPFSPEGYEHAILELSELRDRMIARMEMLTAYTDLFILYEYVMNRLEAVFEETETEVMDTDAVAREILQWIFSETEPATTNSRIKMMLSCLPVRMTKAKFLELVENAFSVYETSDASSVATFDYMLRSAAGMYAPKGMARTYGKLDKVKKLFEEKSLSDLTTEEYAERKEALEKGTEYILNATECLSALQATANALLTVLLTRQYFTLSAEKEAGRPMEILVSMIEGGEVHAEALFEGIEMDMERLSEEVTVLEPLMNLVSESMTGQIEGLMLSTVYHRILVAQRLNSGSAYASLTEETEKEKKVSFAKVKQAFLEDIKEVLETGSRVRNRAVMAEVLKELPVYFNNHTEVMNYVRNSLDSCRDEGEKKICVDLLRSYYE